MIVVKAKTNKQLKKKNESRAKFVQEVKKGKYAPVETSAMIYVHLPQRAETYENLENTSLFYGLR